MGIRLAMHIDAKTKFNKVKTKLEKVENILSSLMFMGSDIIFSSSMSMGDNHP
jgi:hypothetical protein